MRALYRLTMYSFEIEPFEGGGGYEAIAQKPQAVWERRYPNDWRAVKAAMRYIKVHVESSGPDYLAPEYALWFCQYGDVWEELVLPRIYVSASSGDGRTAGRLRRIRGVALTIRWPRTGKRSRLETVAASRADAINHSASE